VPGDFRLTASDRSPQATAVARRNLAADWRAGVRLVQRPLGALLAEERFDFIDLDAPGSPVPFLDAACQALRGGPGGAHLLVTATDAMVLAGAQPAACRRRYGARPLQGELGHEVAVRILLGAIVRAAARYGLAAAPALAYRRGHWYGVYVRLQRDGAGADAALDALGYAVACPRCWDRRAVPGDLPPAACAVCARPTRPAGPLWTGRLWDPALLRRLLADVDAGRPLATGARVRAALVGWLAEAEAPPLFYDLHAAAGHTGAAAVPALEAVRRDLGALGHRSARTHFAPAGVKTDAPAALLLDVVRRAERAAASDRSDAGEAPR
jgi:tRNA (guanine26-N2/guanine27-N2)-dimethyltransferase